MAVHAVAVGLTGSVVAAALARLARRYATAGRLRAITGARRCMLPRALRARLASALDAAALPVTPEQAVEVWLLAAGSATVVGFGIATAVAVCAGVGVVVALPVLLASARHRRAREVAAAVPDTLERIGAELRAGGTVATALAGIARGDGPLAYDVARVETRVRLGASLPDALHAWARERPAVGVDAAAGALALSARVGGRTADALEGLATSLRDRLAVAAETRALSAQARYSAWVIGLAPLAYFVGTAVLDPRSAHALVGTSSGRVCAIAGAALELLGAAWMRAILQGGDRA